MNGHTREEIIKGVETELANTKIRWNQSMLQIADLESYIKVLEWSWASLRKHYADD